jgi:hypothetical protein
MRQALCLTLLLLVARAIAAERHIDFSLFREGEMPAEPRKSDSANDAEAEKLPRFHSTVTGQGKPGTWKIVLDDAPSLLPSLGPQSHDAPPTRTSTKRAVLAQLAQDPADEHFPLLIYEDEVFDDFNLTAQVKTVKGVVEQMAGIAFHIQNETNYYVVRISSLGRTFRFYKVVNGERGVPVGPEMEIPSGVWHELTVNCKGEEIRCSLDGKELITVRDKVNPLTSGKIGFWTKSDSVSYFGDTAITYKPHIAPAQALVGDVMKKYPKLVDVKIYVSAEDARNTRLVGSREPADAGTAGATAERDVIERGSIYFGKDKGTVYVTMPLRDRNGDGIAAACVVMKSFKGQTEKNAVERARPIVQEIQARVQSLQDLVD